MANLIWNVSRTDCYCYLSNNRIEGFTVENSNNCLVLFAELQPNTTYTIQRLDNSSRMRWGIGSKYDNFYYATATFENCFSQGAYPDDSEPHTFTTSNDETFICVYVSNSSEKGIRVQLNEGTEIEEYSEPSIEPSKWYVWYKKPTEIPYNCLNSAMPENIGWTPSRHWICDGSDYPHYSHSIPLAENPVFIPKMRWTAIDDYPKVTGEPNIPVNPVFIPAVRWTFADSSDTYAHFTKHEDLANYEEPVGETD